MATKIDFSSLKLEVMDFNTMYSCNDPMIFINRGTVTFSRGVLEVLNYPAYVQFLLDPKNRVFAVRACKSNETKAKPFSKPRGEQGSTISSSIKAFHSALSRLISEYNENLRYRVCGQTNGDDKILYFSMKDAEVKMLRLKDKEDKE